MKSWSFALAVSLLLLLAAGCDNSTVTQPAPAATANLVPRVLFEEPLQPSVFELPSGALSIWRNYRRQPPTLLLFSVHPFLEPLPEGSADLARDLIRNGSAREIVRRGRLFVPDPVFFPLQTVSAALDAGLLSRVVVVLPLDVPPEAAALERIRKKSVEMGFLSAAEGAGLTLTDGVISGTVRGVPLQMVAPEDLPELAGPLLVHFDLGYFKNLYQNEVTTPAFRMLYDTAKAIREHHYQTLAVTLSCSNQEIGLPLKARFMIPSLAKMVREPALLDQPAPKPWEILSRSLYLQTMFMEAKGRQLLLDNAGLGSDDPGFLFALAQAQFQARQPEQGFATLDRVVALDPGYGLEYVTLAQRGADSGQQTRATALMAKAVRTFPDDPYLRLQQAEMLLRFHRGDAAKPILKALAALPWSPRFHPEMPERIRQLEAKADAQTQILPGHTIDPRYGRHPKEASRTSPAPTP